MNHQGAWALLIISAVVLGLLNLFTQPYEESVSAFPRATAYYTDWVWYVDDILAPVLFIATGVLLLLAVPKGRFFAYWPVGLLGLVCMVMALGDTMDIHWVFTEGSGATDETKSLGSFGSKILTVVMLGFTTIYAFEFLTTRARKALLFAFLLVMINQVHMAVSLEFAGFHFHVAEELVEVVAGLFLFWGACGNPLLLPNLNHNP
jgi:hypothetical protein